MNCLYCSPECKKAFVSAIAAKTMAAMNRRCAPKRMRENNPMHRGDNKERMTATLKAMGWKPPVRKGNGTGLTEQQATLSTALGWKTEVAIPTKMCRFTSGYPTNYKVDIGSEELKIAIEVDGNSHCTIKRKEQDRKKEALLTSLGWTVLRFTNQQVTEHLEECVQTVTSTISKLKKTTTTSQTESSLTTVTEA